MTKFVATIAILAYFIMYSARISFQQEILLLILWRFLHWHLIFFVVCHAAYRTDAICKALSTKLCARLALTHKHDSSYDRGILRRWMTAMEVKRPTFGARQLPLTITTPLTLLDLSATYLLVVLQLFNAYRTPIELRGPGSENLSSIGIRTVETAMLFFDIVSWPYHNGRLYLATFRSFVGFPHPIFGCGVLNLSDSRASRRSRGVISGYTPTSSSTVTAVSGSDGGVKCAPRTRGGAEPGKRTWRYDACSADGRATDTRSYASSRRAGRGQPARGRRFTRNYITVTTAFRMSLHMTFRTKIGIKIRFSAPTPEQLFMCAATRRANDARS
ncbi:hypothetical protein EVAR_38835_1 [Eumeta japonica]|uniref:Uncharacterized protein n=1 Tax=Eumeta variegata TaxID=151549 RepID=A0A4C1XNI9_EUMVA|nr:hypothetical protein EVAR_38835_1 [Eumeta japonica]